LKKLVACLALAAALTGLAACGGKSTGTGASVTASASAEVDPPNETPEPRATAKAEPISLAVAKAKVNGVDADIVTFKGWTVYRFEADENKPPKVNCLNDCLAIWPPLVSDGSPIQLTGIDKSLIGTVKRADGLEQVTLDGWPLYRFRDDKASGDTNGEGLANTWSVVRPDGKPVVKKN